MSESERQTIYPYCPYVLYYTLEKQQALMSSTQPREIKQAQTDTNISGLIFILSELSRCV